MTAPYSLNILSMNKTGIIIVLLALSALSVKAQRPKALEVKQLKLSNGLTVWLNEDHSQPKVYGALVVKAGAKDCPNTGIAHYLEHVLFKGTQRIGTVDIIVAKALGSSLQQRNNVFFVGIIAQTMRDIESGVGNRQRIIGG